MKTKPKLKVAINGYGRIGISVAKIISKRDDIELVAINSTADDDMMIYLTKYDTVQGIYDGKVDIKNGYICIGENVKAKILRERDPNKLDFGKYNAEVIIECTGQFNTQELSKQHLKNGVKKVVMSAPAKDDTPTYVIGVNHKKYSGESIISNASCTTNCLGPVAKLIDDNFGIEKGLITTIHSYTSSQKLLDLKCKKDKRRARAAAVNIIPTTTGAAKAMKLIMPNLDGKLHGQSVRVPVPDGSMVDINFLLKKDVSIEEVNKLFKNSEAGEYKGIIEYDTDYRVSSDICGNPHSSIIASDMTQVIDGNMLKVMAWYDNEWGYSNRLVDMVKYISE